MSKRIFATDEYVYYLRKNRYLEERKFDESIMHYNNGAKIGSFRNILKQFVPRRSAAIQTALYISK